LKDFADLQKDLQQAISKRQWTELNKEIDALRQLAEKIETLEEDRIQAYQTLKSSLQADDQESFIEIVSRLPAKERDELLVLYRHLKAAVIRVKASAGLLNYYVQSMSDALRQILEELFPHRKGKMYSRTGKAKEPGDESLMLYGNA
jgi:AAA+ ATPase superfamily predicted ATPase